MKSKVFSTKRFFWFFDPPPTRQFGTEWSLESARQKKHDSSARNEVWNQQGRRRSTTVRHGMNSGISKAEEARQFGTEWSLESARQTKHDSSARNEGWNQQGRRSTTVRHGMKVGISKAEEARQFCTEWRLESARQKKHDSSARNEGWNQQGRRSTTVRHGMKFGISKAEEAPPAARISIPCVFLIGKGSWEFLSLGVLER